MIVEKAKLIFIHIPKTGGSTFEQYLSSFYGVPLDKTTMFSSEYETINGHSLQHCTYQELKIHLKGQKKDINDYFIISFVRNPFHRLLSELLCFHRIERSTPASVAHTVIVNMFSNENPPLVRGHYTHYDNHLIPQVEFLLDENGHFPQNLALFDMNDINTIMPSLGFTDFAKARRVHVTYRGRVDYDSYFLEETNALIKRAYKEDFDMLFTKPNVLDMNTNAVQILRLGFRV